MPWLPVWSIVTLLAVRPQPPVSEVAPLVIAIPVLAQRIVANARLASPCVPSVVLTLRPPQSLTPATHVGVIHDGQVVGRLLLTSKLLSLKLVKTAWFPVVPLTTRCAPFNRMGPLAA